MKKVSFYLMVMILSTVAYAQQIKPISLYPKGVPGSKKAPASYVEKRENDRVEMVTEPNLTPYFPEKGKANGAAIIICPGGGYARLAIEHEGETVGQKFAAMGITAFVLKYRLPS